MRYEDITNKADIKFIHICAEEFSNQASNHASGSWATDQGGHCYKVIMSVVDLFNFFQVLDNESVRLDGMDFHNHGTYNNNGDQIGISFNNGSSSSVLDYLNISQFSQFNSVFNTSANITFYGCSVARHYSGEYFLTRVGRSLLSSGGGTVRGYTVLGYVHSGEAWLGLEEVPSSHSGESDRDSRTLVITHVRENGLISRIQNARYLTPQITLTRLLRLRESAISLLTNNQMTPGVRSAISEVLEHTNSDRNRLASRPSYSFMYRVHRWLDQEEPRFRTLRDDLSRRPSTCLGTTITSNTCGY